MILVVGGAGYIGSHVLQLLRDNRVPHVAFDNLSQGHLKAVGTSEFFQGDLRSIEDLNSVFEKFRAIDVVMHFAASISVGESEREPAKYWENNFACCLNLLNALHAANVNKIVFSSTAAIFGEPRYTPIDEAHLKNPTSTYGETKLAVEHLLGSFDRAYGLKSVCLRYFNACGASLSGEIGEDHHPEEHLIPLAIAAASGRRPSLKVFGTDWPTPDGTCVRDYIHVLDLAAAHLSAVSHLRSGGDSRKYNLACGNGFSVREILDVVGKVVGKPVPAEDAPRRLGDPAILVGSSKAIENDWGWKPRYTDLEEIVQSAWNWHAKHPNGYSNVS